MDEKENTIYNTYNFFNYIVFLFIYIYLILYQYQINTPAVYFITMCFDIIFSVYLVIFSRFTLVNYVTTISALISIVIFVFIVLRVISSITFSTIFLKIERKRRDQDCDVEDLPDDIINSINLNRFYYLYSTISIFALLFLILFWNDKINNMLNYDYSNIFSMNRRVWTTYFVMILVIIFSIANVRESLHIESLYRRTEICPKL